MHSIPHFLDARLPVYTQYHLVMPLPIPSLGKPLASTPNMLECFTRSSPQPSQWWLRGLNFTVIETSLFLKPFLEQPLSSLLSPFFKNHFKAIFIDHLLLHLIFIEQTLHVGLFPSSSLLALRYSSCDSLGDFLHQLSHSHSKLLEASTLCSF